MGMLCVFFLSSCSKKEEGYILKGTLIDTNQSPYEGYVYLRYENAIDSVLAEKNTFEFRGTVEKPTQASVFLKGNSINAWIYLENSEIKGSGRWWTSFQNNQHYNMFQFDTIEGSQSEDIKKRFRKEMQQIKKEKTLSTEDIYSALKSIATEHPDEPVVGYLFANQASTTYNQLNYDQVNSILKIIDTTAMNSGDMELILLAHKTLKKSGIGRSFASFDLPDKQGNSITLDQFKGNITLVDFWTSWCAPCRRKHPKMIDFYKKNKDKNFAILSISSDQKKENWLKAMEEDNLQGWSNAWDKHSEFLDELGIAALPYSYLLDGEGKILGKNLSFSEIQSYIDE